MVNCLLKLLDQFVVINRENVGCIFSIFYFLLVQTETVPFRELKPVLQLDRMKFEVARCRGDDLPQRRVHNGYYYKSRFFVVPILMFRHSPNRR